MSVTSSKASFAVLVAFFCIAFSWVSEMASSVASCPALRSGFPATSVIVLVVAFFISLAPCLRVVEAILIPPLITAPAITP